MTETDGNEMREPQQVRRLASPRITKAAGSSIRPMKDPYRSRDTNVERVMDELRQLSDEELRQRRMEFSSLSHSAYVSRRAEERRDWARAAAQRVRAAE